jgi:hypothetical protein
MATINKGNADQAITDYDEAIWLNRDEAYAEEYIVNQSQ